MSTTYAGDENNYPASITIPSDGDLKPAATVNVALEGLADRTAAITKNLATAGRVFQWEFVVTGDTPSTYNAFSTTSYDKPASGGFVDVTDVEVGDVIMIDAQFLCELAGGANGLIRLYVIEDEGGGGETETPLNDAKAWLLASTAGFFPTSFHTSYTCAVAGTLRVGVEGKLASGSGPLRMQGSQVIRAVHIKAGV
jgi:hypothetical protein